MPTAGRGSSNNVDRRRERRAGSLQRVLRTTRDLTDARAALDMLAHRLREDGPKMTREQIRERIQYAAEKINSVVPRSPLRDDA